jgi:hypothetical protein
MSTHQIRGQKLGVQRRELTNTQGYCFVCSEEGPASGG